MKRILVYLLVVLFHFTFPGMAGKEKAAKKDKMNAGTFGCGM